MSRVVTCPASRYRDGMDAMKRMRVLRQNVRTDQLLGASALPVGTSTAMDGGAVNAVHPDELSFDEKVRLLDEMDRLEVRTCTACELCRSRTQTVFGEGNPDARLMFIGEGPGQSEDEQGRPFVGRSGELLTKQIQAMGLKRSDVYIANVVKCRPPNNRTPLVPEVEACSGYLRRQIQIIRPEVIITLGGPAAKLVLGTDTGITRLRGIWQEYTGVNPPVPVMPTFHPAYLLRQYTKENRAKVWSDLQAVMERLGL